MSGRMRPETLIRPALRALSAYHVADARGMIKLDAMENPYAWPGELAEAWLAHLRDVRLNRYPDPAAHALKSRLRASLELPASYGLLLGNGSDEIIQLVAMAVAEPGRVLLALDPSFVMYRMIAAFSGMEFVGVPLKSADFSLDLDALLAAIECHRPVLVFIAYPNNPTGNLFPRDAIEQAIAAAPGLVVMDEAYAAFANASFLNRLGEFDNLLIMRTLSKLGLAGLRLGLLVGAPHWLNEIDKLRLPYNINTLTQLSADFALANQAILDAQARSICRERAEMLEALRALPGIQPFPSEANFILLRVPPGAADGLFDALRAAGILVKNLHPAGGSLRDCLRVTVGLPEENRAFLAALRAALERFQ